MPPNNKAIHPINGPIAGIFNQIGNKITATADILAGMFRNTAKIIVSVQQQQQPQ